MHLLPQLLPAALLAQVQDLLAQTLNEPVPLNHTSQQPWQAGRISAGNLASSHKDNAQLDRQHPLYATLADSCVTALYSSPLFMSAALPKTILPPLFSRYAGGQQYGNHIDNALMRHPDTHEWLRSDLSLTLFLSDPDSYAGGELILQEEHDEIAIKLNAGDAILYPTHAIHRVAPVTAGTRLAMVTWVQSVVADRTARDILLDLDLAHVFLRQRLAKHLELLTDCEPELARLNKSYHNLLRRWAQC